LRQAAAGRPSAARLTSEPELADPRGLITTVLGKGSYVL